MFRPPGGNETKIHSSNKETENGPAFLPAGAGVTLREDYRVGMGGVVMKPVAALFLVAAPPLLPAPLLPPLAASPAAAQAPSGVEKLNAYIGCINRLSERSYSSRSRYFRWGARPGPTGKERIIYGTYTIYDTSDCVKNVEKANALEPRDAEIEAAATDYAK